MEILRKHLYDLLAEHVIDPKAEVRTLCELFSEEYFYDGVYKVNLEQFTDNHVFRSLSFRGTLIRISDMRTALGISDKDFQFRTPVYGVPLERMFLLMEFFLGIYEEGQFEFARNSSAMSLMTTINDNIVTVLSKLNYELQDISNDDIPRYIVVERNKLVTEAVEIIEDRPLALAVIEYNHYSLRGCLSDKRAILCQLANHVEPILSSNILREGGYSNLQSDVKFLLNNFHIRHNNKDGKSKKEYIANVSDAELETWYDRAYSMMLAVIVENENCKIHTELSKLKDDHKWT